jgi:hypothetical protein
MKQLFKILSFPILAICLALATVELYPVLLWGIKHYALYKWFGAGFGAYFILRLLPFVRKNGEVFQTFTHELTHTIVAAMFMRKIHYFHAEEHSGVMGHSGGKFGNIFIMLAPYCLPIFTYAFLILRLLSDLKLLYVFDILIGFTTAFHAVCFAKQTRNYQTDIQNYGLATSSLFISAFLFFNVSIILLSIKYDIWTAFCKLFTSYCNDIIVCWNYIF